VKIINLSLPKSATKSFHKFVSDFGLSSLHFIDDHFAKHMDVYNNKNLKLEDILKIYKPIEANYSCLSDTPVPMLHSYLLKKYSDENFLYIKRDKESWSKSYINHQIKNKQSFVNVPIIDKIFIKKFLGVFITDYKDITLELCNTLYEEYENQVFQHAKKINVNISVFKLEDIELEKKLNKYIKDILLNKNIKFEMII